ncbi:MAG: DUF4249 family protein [Rhodothermaceae bacterium]|nr:DUF4249 family protein [Rhodothermaceae bacterium]MYC05562.1 DUF4249 family protein [Rhodothermaceae bacterium]MYI18174.1 DUF4249 family protein [Rhodothermaceae bacterium]
MRSAILVVVSFLTGCISPVELDFPGSYSPKIVVNSAFTPDSVWTVYLQQSIPYTDTIDWEEQYILDAGVYITDGQGTNERLLHVEDGIYKSSQGLHPVPGIEYALMVDAPSFTPVQAKSSAPELTVYLDSIEELQEPDRYNPGLYEAALSLEDQVGNHRYSIEILQVWPECNERQRYDNLPPLENAGTGLRPGKLESSFPGLYPTPVEAEDASEEPSTTDGDISAVYFSDRLFEQEVVKINLTLEVQYYGEVAPYFMIVVSNWSRELWDYRISDWRSTGFDYDYFLASPRPVSVITNVENGLGFFAGITHKTFRSDRQGMEWTDEQVNLGGSCDDSI